MIELRILGRLELCDTTDGRRITSVLAQHKRLALLCHLAVAARGTALSRDTLLALFWPELDDIRARQSLRQSLYFLRRSLGGDVIASRADGSVGVDASRLDCDAAAFEVALDAGYAEEALQLYQGELLPGFHLSDAPGFERWLEEERLRLRQRALAAATFLAREREVAGNRLGALDSLRRARELDPWDEALLRTQLEIMTELGDRSGAVLAFNRFEERLRSELELEPSTATLGLIEALREDPVAGSAEGTPAPVVVIPADSEPPPSTPARPQPVRAFPRKSSVRYRRAILFSAVVVVAVLLAVRGIGSFTPFGSDALPDDTGSGAAQERILVMPFREVGGAGAPGALGTIAADWVIQGLVQWGIAEVVGSALVAVPAEGSRVSAQEPVTLALETGATLLITGSYIRADDRVTFRAQLADARTGAILRVVEGVEAASNEPMAGIGELRNRILGGIATHLDPAMRGWSGAANQPPDLRAYELYVEGVRYYLKRPSDWEKAKQVLLEAAGRDSTFTAPLLWAYHVNHAGTSADPGIRARERHLEDSLGHVLRMRRDRLTPWERAVVDGETAFSALDFSAALAGFRDAERIAPLSAWSNHLALSAMRAGHYEEGIELLGRLLSTQPYDDDLHFLQLTRGRHALGQHRLELEEARLWLERFPTSGNALAGLAAALIGNDRIPEALAFVDSVSERARNGAFVLEMVARELRTHGYVREARLLFDRALAGAADSSDSAGGLPPYELRRRGRILLELGRLDEARFSFSRAAEIDTVFFPVELGVIAALQGDRREAERILTHLEAYGGAAGLLPTARIRVALGDTAAALSALAGLARSDRFVDPWVAHVVPEFQQLRADPEFRRLVR